MGHVKPGQAPGPDLDGLGEVAIVMGVLAKQHKAGRLLAWLTGILVH